MLVAFNPEMASGRAMDATPRTPAANAALRRRVDPAMTAPCSATATGFRLEMGKFATIATAVVAPWPARRRIDHTRDGQTRTRADPDAVRDISLKLNT